MAGFQIVRLLSVTAGLFIAANVLGLQIREQSFERHSRLLPGTEVINRNFLFYDYDPSGIAIRQNSVPGAGRALLITRRHFVTTSHTSNTHPSTLTFLSRDGALRVYPVLRYTVIEGSTDLTLGTLVEPISEEAGIAHYPIARITGDSYEAAMVGLFGMNGTAGINRIDGGMSPLSETFRHRYDIPPNGFFGRGRDEAAPTMGDSGHAMVAAYAGRLFALGVHYTTTSAQSIPRHIESLRMLVEADGERLTIFEGLPRAIADFDPASHDRLWQDASPTGGTQLMDQNAAHGPLGRIGNKIGKHHLYALNVGQRPLLYGNEATFPFLRFTGNQALVTTRRHAGSARAFQFELNTEAPRLTWVLRVPLRTSGIRPIMEIHYDSDPLPYRLEYDHEHKRLRSTGFGESVGIPMGEGVWVVVEWSRQREFIALAINGDAPVRQAINSRHNADTDFSRLILGSIQGADMDQYFDLSRLIIKDTGLTSDSALIHTLMKRYNISPGLKASSPWSPDPDGSEILTYTFETAPAAGGPFSKVRLTSTNFNTVPQGWTLDLPRVNQPARYLRVNRGQANRIAATDTRLHIQLQGSNGSMAALEAVQSEDWTVELNNGILRLRGQPPIAASRWYRMLASE